MAAESPMRKLVEARKLCLLNPENYVKLIPTILPIIPANTPLELRRWGADFIAETLASPVLPAEDKQALSLQLLPLLKDYLEVPSQDDDVVMSILSAAASVYPIIFKYIIYNPDEAPPWQTMLAVKSNILRRMDTLRPGLRKCCIKFVQVVVQCQTPAQVDPRRKDAQDISSALLPPTHPILSPKNLEPEAEGLLDRILSILQEDPTDTLLIDATLNGFGPLLTTRMTISHKIINAILGFNILKMASQPMTPLNKILMRSMEKTISRLLQHWLKRHGEPEGQPHRHSKKDKRKLTHVTRFQQNPLAHRVTEYLHNLAQMHLAVFNEARRKRPAPAEPTDGLNEAKRQRLGAQVPPLPQQPAQAAAPSLPAQMPDIPIEQRARVLALTDDPRIFNFDINKIPFQMVVQMIIAVLQSTPQAALDAAIASSRSQILQYVTSQTEANNRIPLDVPADDDYDPLDLKVAEDSAQIANQMDMDSAYVSEPQQQQNAAGLGGAQLPAAPPLDWEKLRYLHATTVERLLQGLDAQRSTAAATAATGTAPSKGKGLQVQAPTNHDRSSYLTFLTRLATRVPISLEPWAKPANGVGVRGDDIAESIRQRLLQYVLQDWRKRIGVAISWLTEEWLSDTIINEERARQQQQKAGRQKRTTGSASPGAGQGHPNYDRWLNSLLDELSAFIGADTPEIKVLIRLLSEIPSVSKEVIEKVKRLALDPERIALVVPALRYLVLYRVPVRQWCLDALVDMYENYEGAKGLVRKDLVRWRPQVLAEENAGKESGKTEGGADGVKPEG